MEPVRKCLLHWITLGMVIVASGEFWATAALAENKAAREYFTDVVLINQHREELRLYSDLLAGRVVIINAFCITCDSVSHLTLDNLVKIQEHLGSRLDEEARILSLTVDRESDSPELLAVAASTFGARPGWHFLTGSPENLDFALRKLGLWAEEKEAHSTILLIGNAPTGLWKKANGMAPPADLIEIVDSVLDDRL